MRALLIALLLVGSGCASSRGVVQDADVTGRLGFLNGPGLTRADVEARLGGATAHYEKDSVVSYPVYVGRDGRLTTTLADARAPRYTLMLEYAPDGHVRRHALLRRVEAQ